MDIAILIGTVSSVIKVLVDLVDRFIFPGKQTQIKAIIISEGLCFLFKLNIFAGIEGVSTLMGIIATGIIMTFGSGVAHEVYSAVQKLKGKVKKK